MRRLPHVALVTGLLLLATATPAWTRVADPFTRLREQYLLAVERESAIPQGLRTIEELRAGGMARPGSAEDAVLTAYRGALVPLRAKHAVWPPTRLRHLREGLAVLDRAAPAHPEQVEVRSLRLLSCYYLPGVLGRGWSVREDFAALARLLPGARDAYPPELYGAIVRFVLENGRLAERERRALGAALAGAGDG